MALDTPPPPLSACLLACHTLLARHLPAFTLSSYIGKLVLVDAPEGPKVVRRKKSRSPTGSVGGSVKGSVRGASRSPSPTGSVGSSAARKGPRQPLKPAPVEPKRQVGDHAAFQCFPPSLPACFAFAGTQTCLPSLASLAYHLSAAVSFTVCRLPRGVPLFLPATSH